MESAAYPAEGEAWRLVPAAAGEGAAASFSLDALGLKAAARRKPARGEVEIEVRAAGLNFIDVMKALGIYPGADAQTSLSLGLECAGVIRKVGEGVEQFQPGQEVAAFAVQSMSSHVIANAHLVQPKPPELSFEAAATLPVVYLTAYYGLYYLGRISGAGARRGAEARRGGERVLIHSAAGGVGLAAIELARHFGAEVFATAGSEEKRSYLRSLGIRAVMDSRSLDFAAETMQATDGQGVDLVLNSLTGEAMQRSLALLAPYGRFIEIGKRDIYQNTNLGLSPFRNNLSYFAVDLERLARERPEFLGGLFAEVMELLRSGAIHPLPVTTFAAQQASEAFRFMAQAKHIGKIALQQWAAPFRQPDLVEGQSQPTAHGDDLYRPPLLRPDASYLITGGLGALGLAVADWLAAQGARHLVLVSRRGAEAVETDAALSKRLETLRGMGIEVWAAQADVGSFDQLAKVIQSIAAPGQLAAPGPGAVSGQTRAQMPPLRGVIHAAGILEDGILLQSSAERFQHVLLPKASGAWNLHLLTANTELDFFIMFSSVTAVLGSPGQGNYAAANGFLDGLAHYRRRLGLPALSINWGPWSEIGLAAAGGADQRDASSALLQGLKGLPPLSPQEGIAIFGSLLEQASKGTAQVIATGLDAGQWQQAHPAARRSSLFRAWPEPTPTSHGDDRQRGDKDHRSPLPVPPAAEQNELRAALLAAETGRARRSLLEKYLQEQTGQVLRLAASRVDVHKPLSSMGIDSLMTIELRNRLETGLNLTLSATLVWNYPTIAEMAAYLAEKMGISLTTADKLELPTSHGDDLYRPPLPTSHSPLPTANAEDAELEALLADELDAIDDLLKKGKS